MDNQTPSYKHGNMGMKNPIAAACIVLTLLFQVSRAADVGDFPQVDRAMQELIANHEIAGAVTLVADKDRILHESAVGQTNIEKSEAMKPDAIFWIASMTKPVTATAIMILQKRGSCRSMIRYPNTSPSSAISKARMANHGLCCLNICSRTRRAWSAKRPPT
jgi:hypothetical protein